MGLAAKKRATDIITELFSGIKEIEGKGAEATMSARLAGRMLVEVYRLLAGEMPQSPGIEIEFRADELPGVELASPTERDPNRVRYVQPGDFLDPDLIWEDEKNAGIKSCLDGTQARPGTKRLQPPGEGKT